MSDPTENWTPEGEHSEHAPSADEVVRTATRSTSSRGFTTYDEFTDLYGSRLTVRQSSRAFYPALWLNVDAWHGDEGGLHKDGSGHMTLPQAKRLVAALQAGIAEGEKLIADGYFWPESDNDEPQNWDEDETREQGKDPLR